LSSRERPSRSAAAREQLGTHEAELRELINRDKAPLSPKTAFLRVKTKHELDVRYGTFRRFARTLTLNRKQRRAMIRIELPPGQETQLDYGHVGSLADPVSRMDRAVYAFCGLLERDGPNGRFHLRRESGMMARGRRSRDAEVCS